MEQQWPENRISVCLSLAEAICFAFGRTNTAIPQLGCTPAMQWIGGRWGWGSDLIHAHIHLEISPLQFNPPLVYSKKKGGSCFGREIWLHIHIPPPSPSPYLNSWEEPSSFSNAFIRSFVQRCDSKSSLESPNWKALARPSRTKLRAWSLQEVASFRLLSEKNANYIWKAFPERPAWLLH